MVCEAISKRGEDGENNLTSKVKLFWYVWNANNWLSAQNKAQLGRKWMMSDDDDDNESGQGFAIRPASRITSERQQRLSRIRFHWTCSRRVEQKLIIFILSN